MCQSLFLALGYSNKQNRYQPLLLWSFYSNEGYQIAVSALKKIKKAKEREYRGRCYFK